MRKIICIMVALFIFLFSAIQINAAGDITVKIEGKQVYFTDAKPFINKESRTVVPLRFISEALGATVDWNGKTKTVTVSYVDVISQPAKKIILKIGESKATVGGVVKTFDTKAVIVNGRTFVPLRFISESYGKKVDWDGKTRTISIYTYKQNANTDDSKVIADMFRTVIDMEMKGDYAGVYPYGAPDYLKKHNVTKPEEMKGQYEYVSGGYKNLIEISKIQKYETKCVVKKISDNQCKVIYALYSLDHGTPHVGLAYNSVMVYKINGKWCIDFSTINVLFQERFDILRVFKGEEI